MPYYHPTETPEVTDSSSYIAHYLKWLRTYVDQPLFITEVRVAFTHFLSFTLLTPSALQTM